jgi:serine/threonine-protein kinase
MRAADSTPFAVTGMPSHHLVRLENAGFKVQHTVSAGKFGVVYRARDLASKRDVAVKVIDLEKLRPSQGPHSETEIETLASLRHPHIVPLYASGKLDDTTHYFVMPFIDGPSLRARLRREVRLPIVEALRYGIEIADALSALHARGLIHRDVKPENILIDGRHAMLTDFGLVCESHAAVADEDDDPVVGTPTYMAPEQWHHGAAIDGRADIFGLACLIYECLTGTAPNEERLHEPERRSMREWDDRGGAEHEAAPYESPMRPVVNLRERRPEASPRLEELLRRALRLDPAARLATADAFRDALEVLLADEMATSGLPRWLRGRR